jgi:hypothetical protein
MLENMAGAVGFAMHEDRLTKAAKNIRLAEAKHGRHGAPQGARAGQRARIAAALVTLAARIAPMVTLAGGQTRLTAR